MKTSFAYLTFIVALIFSPLAFAQPVIVTQPQEQTVVQGGTATFTVEVTGTPPLTYEWREYINQVTFTNPPDGANSTLVLTNVQRTFNRFGVLVSNAEGEVLSDLARLNVLQPPTINFGPVGIVGDVGGSVAMGVNTTGDPPLFYQWFKNGVPIEGATLSTFSLANLSTNDWAGYSVLVSNAVGNATSPEAFLTLIEKVTSGPVVTDQAASWGAAWGDYNGDGWIDLFVPNGWPNVATNFLYRNNGDGTFTSMQQAEVGRVVTDTGVFSAATWGDLDNDGFVDLIVSNWQGPGGGGNLIYRNNGDGTFTPASSPNPVLDDRKYTGNISLGDYNNDGHVDLFAADARDGRYVMGGFQDINTLYRNNGDGTFTSDTTAGIATEFLDSEMSAWADYDNDNDLDLVVPSGADGILFFVNQGDGTLARALEGALPMSAGLARFDPQWGDFNNDGYLDLVVTDLNNSGSTFLYRNNTLGDFIPERLTGRTDSAAWGDIDNDGDLDLFLSRLEDVNDIILDNMLYINNGSGSFHLEPNSRLVNDGGASQGACVWGDYDNNGFLDLFVANLTATPSFLYRNIGNQNHWLMLNLVGTVGNRSAIGAKVRVKADIREQTTWQLREISGGGFGQNDLRAHFGLGDAAVAEIVRIEWPSGQVQELENVAANQILTVIEPPRLTTDAPGSIQLQGGKGMIYTLQSSLTMETGTWSDMVILTNESGTVSYLDSEAGVQDQRFYRAVQEP